MLFFLRHGLLRCGLLVRFWLLAFLSPVAHVECHCSFCCPYCFEFLAPRFIFLCTGLEIVFRPHLEVSPLLTVYVPGT